MGNTVVEENVEEIIIVVEEVGWGDNTYVYIGYASDDLGADFSLIPTDNLKYRAEITSTEELNPPTGGDFTGAIWVKYIGDDGANGKDGTDGRDGTGVPVDQDITEGSDNAARSGGTYDYVNENLALFSKDSVKEVSVFKEYDGFYVNSAGGWNGDANYKIVVFETTPNNNYVLNALVSAINVPSAGIGAFVSSELDNSSSAILSSLKLQEEETTKEYSLPINIVTNGNYLFVSQRKANGGVFLYEYIDVEKVEEDATVAIEKSTNVENNQGYVLNSLFASLQISSVTDGLYINYAGNGLWANTDYETLTFKVTPNTVYRILGQVTATSDNNGMGAWGEYENTGLGSMVDFQLQAKDTVVQYDSIITTSPTTNIIYVSQKKADDSFSVKLMADGEKVVRKSENMPYFGKKVFHIGDSYTYNGYYFTEFLKANGMVREGSTGVTGNGRELVYMPYMILNDFTTEIANADVVTILGGTNDYGNTTTSVGSITDTPPSLVDLEAGVQPTTVYGAVKALVNSVMSINPNAKIVFYSQPERGTFDSKPVNTTPPDENDLGLSMYNLAKAIEDCCNFLGVAYCNTHQTLWNFQQIGIYTSDNLHPADGAGGEMLGRQMGKFINKL